MYGPDDTQPNRERFLATIDGLIVAAEAVDDAFINTDAATRAYPRPMASFDDWTSQLRDWRDAISAEVERGKRAPVPFITFSSDDPTDVRCVCGNHPGADGLYPCDVNGVEVQPNAYAWPLALSVCARCRAIYHQPPTMQPYAGLTIYGEYPKV